jgi:hypothetical protein
MALAWHIACAARMEVMRTCAYNSSSPPRYIYRIRVQTGIGSTCGPGASPTPAPRESARDVPQMRKYLRLTAAPARPSGFRMAATGPGGGGASTPCARPRQSIKVPSCLPKCQLIPLSCHKTVTWRTYLLARCPAVRPVRSRALNPDEI